MLNVKNADMADFEQIMKIYKYAQDYMIKSGNPVQWGHFYPDPVRQHHGEGRDLRQTDRLH